MKPYFGVARTDNAIGRGNGRRLVAIEL